MSVPSGPLRTGPSTGAAEGRSDVFLKVVTKRSRVKGEATTGGHEDDIGLVGWTWGVSANTAIGSSAATARRSYKMLVVTKTIDSASTALMSALASNDEVKEAVLTMRKAGGEALDYFTMRLAGARIVAVDVEVGPDGIPHERVSIAFTKIEVEYQRQQKSGGAAGAFTFTDEVLPA